MKRVRHRLWLALGVVLSGQGSTAADEEWVARRLARLQALDKVTARVSILEAPVGGSVSFGTLTIRIGACYGRPPDEVPDAAAWLEIRDARARTSPTPAFRGWMFASAPGVNMLEHPVYDIRLLECR